MKTTLSLLLALGSLAKAHAIHHYVFFAHERERIRESSFLETQAFEGAQLKYTWRELEPAPDSYQFQAIRRDLEFLHRHNKRLFIQLQDSTFDSNYFAVPKYLLTKPEYHGGAAPQYEIPNNDNSRAVPAGWIARRWDPAVQTRFHKLLTALGREFDGKIEGINLPESSADFGESGKLYPAGFTPALYRNAILTNMFALKRAFPISVAMQYANFMPGEWLPDEDRGLLRSIYIEARNHHIGIGGPDLLPYKPAQMHHAYALMPALAGYVPLGISVQDGNYEHQNPKTKKQVTIDELNDFARKNLKADYIFWCTQEPFYSRSLIPFLKENGKAENDHPKP